MHTQEDWRDYLSVKHRAILKAIENDQGKAFSRTLLAVAFHHYAELSLKRVSPQHHHADIERVFGFNIGMVPGNRYHEAKKAADHIALPILQQVDGYIGLPARTLAAWAEGQFVIFDKHFMNWLQRQ